MQAVCIMGTKMTKLPCVTNWPVLKAEASDQPSDNYTIIAHDNKSTRTQRAATMLRIFKPGVGMAIFGVRVLVAFSAFPPVLAHEAHAAEQQAATTDESAFLAENEAAMNKMMSAMAARPTGDIDRDFVAMMAPHHQGAIDMAVIELRYGKNEQLRRIAQEIIIDQMQEMAAMKLAIGEQVTPSAPAPTQPGQTPATPDHMHMPSEMKK
jgi:hypothetical protein